MTRLGGGRTVFALLVALCALAVPAKSVQLAGDIPGLFVAPADDGGWDYVGDWGDFTGIAIGPRHFLTAAHVGGYVGKKFVFRGETYRAVAVVRHPDADLAVWQTDRALPSWAVVARNDDTETDARVIGRGRERGDPILLSGQRIGWNWGGGSGRKSWGVTKIAGRTNPAASRRAAELIFHFDPTYGRRAATVASGDSGGGVFVPRGTDWALVGVVRAVDREWSRDGTDSGRFVGSLTDCRGLWHRAGPRGDWTKVPTDRPCSTSWSAVRLTPVRPWIVGVLNDPLAPNWYALGLLGSAVTIVGIGGGAAVALRKTKRGPAKVR